MNFSILGSATLALGDLEKSDDSSVATLQSLTDPSSEHVAKKALKIYDNFILILLNLCQNMKY